MCCLFYPFDIWVPFNDAQNMAFQTWRDVPIPAVTPEHRALHHSRRVPNVHLSEVLPEVSSPTKRGETGGPYIWPQIGISHFTHRKSRFPEKNSGQKSHFPEKTF